MCDCRSIPKRQADIFTPERFGAMRLLDDPLKLILPLTLIAEAITAAQKKNR